MGFRTAGYGRHGRQFDFNLLVDGKSIERMYFLQYYKNFRQFCLNLEPKVKGMFLFTIYKFFILYITMSIGRGRGSNKLLYKEAAPRSEPYQLYRVLLI